MVQQTWVKIVLSVDFSYGYAYIYVTFWLLHALWEIKNISTFSIIHVYLHCFRLNTIWKTHLVCVRSLLGFLGSSIHKISPLINKLKINPCLCQQNYKCMTKSKSKYSFWSIIVSWHLPKMLECINFYN